MPIVDSEDVAVTVLVVTCLVAIKSIIGGIVGGPLPDVGVALARPIGVRLGDVRDLGAFLRLSG